jgi:hypothetical protein
VKAKSTISEDDLNKQLYGHVGVQNVGISSSVTFDSIHLKFMFAAGTIRAVKWAGPARAHRAKISIGLKWAGPLRPKAQPNKQ